jgi:hypothetical protein
MADPGAAAPPVAVLPAPGGLAPSVLPDAPFGDEPGSLSSWILVETTDETNAEVHDYINRVQQRYTDIPDPIAHPNEYEDGLQGLMEDVLGSVDFAGFLQVSTLGDGMASVQAVSNFARYSAGLGSSRAMSGRVVGFLGEMVDDQLPPLILVPRITSTLKHLLTPSPVQVPTRDQILAHAALPAPATLLPGLAANAPEVDFCRLTALPTAWVPFFMEAKPPIEAWRTMTQLVATLDTEAMRDAAEYLVDWCAAACVRSGHGQNQRLLSQLNSPWESPAAPDRKVLSWAKRRLAPFRSVPEAAQMPMMPPPDPALWGAGLAATSNAAAKQYSELEHTKIRLMCSLTEEQYDTMRPPVYSQMLSEGRTMAKVDALLHQCLAPNYDADVPVHIFVTQDMVRDLKDLRFGRNSDFSFETCHRGISPFAVVAVSQEAASHRKRAQERARRATLLTPGDVESLESRPGLCPHDYAGMMRLLAAYLWFLTVMSGTQCSHYLEVKEVRRILCKYVAVF